MGELTHYKCLIVGSFQLPLTWACSSCLALPTHCFPPAPTPTASPESSHHLLLSRAAGESGSCQAPLSAPSPPLPEASPSRRDGAAVDAAVLVTGTLMPCEQDWALLPGPGGPLLVG